MRLTSVVEERFSSEVKLAYQRSISKFESLVTLRNVENAEKTYFNKSTAGGEAQKKGIFGEIPDIGGGVGRVECNLATFYAKNEIAAEDIENTSIDENLIMTTNVASAIERNKDTLIKTALAASTNEIAHGDTGLTIDKVNEIWQKHSDNLIFEYGEIPINMVSTKQWQELMALEQFNDADKIGPADLPYLQTKAIPGRLWYDMIWMTDPKLNVASEIRTCFSFVKSCVGMGVSNVQKTVLEENNLKDSVLHWVKYKAGAVIIDDTGVIKVGCSEAAST